MGPEPMGLEKVGPGELVMEWMMGPEEMTD